MTPQKKKPYKCKKGCKKAADGLVNQEVAPQGGGSPAEGGGAPPAQPGGGGGGTPAVSVSVQPVVNVNGQTQPLDQLTLQSKDDIPKLSQYLMQVFDTIMQGGGGGQAQPGQGGEPTE